MQKICGIYLIICRPQDCLPLYYVGQSVDVTRRIKQHRAQLANGKHFNQKLLRFWKKYGASCFTFELIDVCDVAQLDAAELWWLNQMIGHARVFNVGTDPVAPMRGRRFSDEHRSKISASHSGERHYLFGRSHSTSVKERISKGGKGLRRSLETRTAIKMANTGPNNPMFGRHGAQHARSRAVTAVCIKTGVVKQYESATLAERDGYRQECISRCCNGLSQHHKGMRWMFT